MRRLVDVDVFDQIVEGLDMHSCGDNGAGVLGVVVVVGGGGSDAAVVADRVRTRTPVEGECTRSRDYLVFLPVWKTITAETMTMITLSLVLVLKVRRLEPRSLRNVCVLQ